MSSGQLRKETAGEWYFEFTNLIGEVTVVGNSGVAASAAEALNKFNKVLAQVQETLAHEDEDRAFELVLQDALVNSESVWRSPRCLNRCLSGCATTWALRASWSGALGRLDHEHQRPESDAQEAAVPLGAPERLPVEEEPRRDRLLEREVAASSGDGPSPLSSEPDRSVPDATTVIGGSPSAASTLTVTALPFMDISSASVSWKASITQRWGAAPASSSAARRGGWRRPGVRAPASSCIRFPPAAVCSNPTTLCIRSAIGLSTSLNDAEGNKRWRGPS
jgi:hypothetical protein